MNATAAKAQLVSDLAAVNITVNQTRYEAAFDTEVIERGENPAVDVSNTYSACYGRLRTAARRIGRIE